MAIQVKNQSYIINGRRQFLYSGEFHYFRVPKGEWEKRLLALKEMHGNCVATYVPWIIHEPEEGKILWDDVDARSLTDFLELCSKLELQVILRPGPLQYAELVNQGLPNWLYDKYPQIQLRRIDGSIMHKHPSYMHPVFLEKTRTYFKAFAEVAGKYMSKNGGPVSMVQVDNENMGIHVWRGSIDYNAETYGFGKEDGRYAGYLKAKYKTIGKLNQAYCTEYTSFAEVYPEKYAPNERSRSRQKKDYFDFYVSMNAEYLRILADWLREDGIEEIICHNSGSPGMNGYFDQAVDKMGAGFLLGSDHYYNLNQTWPQNNPTPQYALTMFMSCEQLRNMGMPPTALELPGGSLSDTIPILPEDILACYMTNVAMGLKGINIYIFTGGKNFGQTGTTGDVYDYHALIRANGDINPTYHAAKRFGSFIEEHAWLQEAERLSAVRVAYENEWNRSERFGLNEGENQTDAYEFVKRGVLYSLMASEYAPEMVDISRQIPDTDKPLVLCAPTALSEQAQRNTVAFVKAGGNLLLLNTMPALDEDYQACTILKDFLGFDFTVYGEDKRGFQQYSKSVALEGMDENIYYLNFHGSIADKDCTPLGYLDDEKKDILFAEKEIGNAKVIFGAVSFNLTVFSQLTMMRTLVSRLGAKETLYHSNEYVFTSLFEGRNGEKMVFLMNLYSGKNTTDIRVGDKVIEGIQLEPMEVKTICLQ